jgi:hypothetical protein
VPGYQQFKDNKRALFKIYAAQVRRNFIDSSAEAI